MMLFCFLFLLSFPLHANAMSVPRICVVDTRRSSDAASLMSSIRKNGGTPVLVTTKKKIRAASYDGLALPGGGDVNPALYHEKKQRIEKCLFCPGQSSALRHQPVCPCTKTHSGCLPGTSASQCLLRRDPVPKHRKESPDETDEGFCDPRQRAVPHARSHCHTAPCAPSVYQTARQWFDRHTVLD